MSDVYETATTVSRIEQDPIYLGCLQQHVVPTVMRFRKPKKKGRNSRVDALVVRDIFKIGTADPRFAEHL